MSKLLKFLAQDTGQTLSAVRAQHKVQATVVADRLRLDGKVVLPGIGTISLQLVKQRVGRNPISGAKQTVPEHRAIKFTPAQQLTEAL